MRGNLERSLHLPPQTRTNTVKRNFVGSSNRGSHKVISQCLFWSEEPKKEFVPSYPAFQVTPPYLTHPLCSWDLKWNAGTA